MENITIVARHLDITEAIKNYALQKAEKIKKFLNGSCRYRLLWTLAATIVISLK